MPEVADTALPASLADMDLLGLAPVRALLQGGIAAMERMERLHRQSTAALIVDEGQVCLILTPTAPEAA